MLRDPLSTFLRAIAALALFVSAAPAALAQATPVYGYTVVAKYPHSTDNFTEGFYYADGLFYEGTGMEGRSGMQIYEPTGKVVQRYVMPGQYFGEGIINVGPTIYQWTWQTHMGLVLDRMTLKPIRTFTYTGEGWGMTRDSTNIITSDGSSTLRFRDQKTFAEVRHIVVTDNGKPVEQLNELEYIKGEIWANVWHEYKIARINPKDGKVLGWVDISGILPKSQMKDEESVPNGIAYDAAKDRIFITGKQWPAIFEIKVAAKK
jgi:glutamine cyclotransferase